MGIRKQFREELAAWHGRVAWIFFFALATAPALFIAVAWVQVAPATSRLTPPEGGLTHPVLVGVLGTLALLAAVAGILTRRLATPERLATWRLRVKGDSPRPPESDEERRLVDGVARYQVALIVALALLESAALSGFILSFLLRDLRYVLVFSAVAIAINLLFLRPDPSIYARLAKAIRAS